MTEEMGWTPPSTGQLPNFEGVPCTLAIIKPDAFHRELRGRIVDIILNAGFNLHRTRMTQPTREAMVEFYGRQHEGKPYFDALVDFMSSGRCMFTILSHEDEAIDTWRSMMGAAVNPARATLRAMFCRDYPIMENLVHGSDSIESFEHEEATLLRHDLLTV